VAKALKHTLAAVVFVATAVLAIAAAAQTGTGPKIAHFTLANGLELVVIPDHRAPVVTHMIWYKVGAADETPGKSGLAHFLEHLMFKGTKKHAAGYFSQLVSDVGGRENAFTSSDYTAFFQHVPRAQLSKMMELEADRMNGLVLTDDVVLPERNVILEEQNMRVGNRPRSQFDEQVEAALFLNSPYGRPVIGWRREIEKLDRKDVIAFYRRFYAPNNAIVVVAGDVDPDQVLTLARATYGQVQRDSQIGPRMRPQEPPPVAVRTVTFADPRVEQPILQRDYLVPSETTAKRGESEAIEVLSHLLGGGSTSRLYRSLVVDKGLAVDVGSDYDGTAVDATHFDIYAAPRPGVSLAQLEQGVDSVIAEIIDKGVSSEELEHAKTRLVADALYAQDSQSTMARWYGAALATGQTVDSVRTWPDRIRQVTAQQVQDAARKWFDKRRSVTGYLVKQPPQGQEKHS
jgi:zinc protease